MFEDCVVVSAPGKVILTGEHAVVYGKTALAASLSLRLFVNIQRTDVGQVTLDLKDFGTQKCWSCDELASNGFLEHSKSPRRPSPDEIKTLKKLCGMNSDKEVLTVEELAIITFLFLMLSICSDSSERFPSLSVEMKSQFPFAAGLGSSAAYSVCLSAGFLTFAKAVTPTSCKSNGGITLPVGVEALTTTSCYNESDLKLINMWALEGERLIHGNPSGIDNTICTYGGCMSYTKGDIMPLPRVPSLRILLIDTKVPRSTKRLVAGVRERYDKYPTIIGPVLDAIGNLSDKFRTLLYQLADGESDDESRDLKLSLFSELETLWDINQHLLQAIGVSHASINDICSITAKYGLYSKLTGGGGGGSVIALINQTVSDDDISLVQSSLTEKGYGSQEAILGGYGVLLHSV